MNAEATRCREHLMRFETAMLLTHDDDKLHQGTTRTFARPMAVVEVAETCELWFLSDKRSAKVAHIAGDAQVEVVYQSESWFGSLQGEAELVSDTRKIKQLWKDGYQTWLPIGKDDPNVVLIRVVPTYAEFWDASGAGHRRFLFEGAKTHLEGERVETGAAPVEAPRVRM